MQTTQNDSDWIDALAERVKGLRYGTIEVVIHQGRVTQIETTEKIRFESPAASQVDPANQTRPPERSNHPS